MLITDKQIYNLNIEDGVYHFKVTSVSIETEPKHLLKVNTILFLLDNKQIYYTIYFNLRLQNNVRLINFLHSIGVKREYEPYLLNTKDFINKIGIARIQNNYPVNFIYQP